MKVQQVSKKQEIRFGKAAFISANKRSILNMLRGDFQAIGFQNDNVRIDMFEHGILISDGLEKVELDGEVLKNFNPATAATYKIKGFTGALRSNFDKIIKSENPVEEIIVAFTTHNSL